MTCFLTCPNLSQQKHNYINRWHNIIHLIQKIQAILQDARTDSFCLPLSSYLESDCSQEWQGEGDGQVESQPLSQQPPHHRLWQRHGGSQHWEDKGQNVKGNNSTRQTRFSLFLMIYKYNGNFFFFFLLLSLFLYKLLWLSRERTETMFFTALRWQATEAHCIHWIKKN